MLASQTFKTNRTSPDSKHLYNYRKKKPPFRQILSDSSHRRLDLSQPPVSRAPGVNLQVQLGGSCSESSRRPCAGAAIASSRRFLPLARMPSHASRAFPWEGNTKAASELNIRGLTYNTEQDLPSRMQR